MVIILWTVPHNFSLPSSFQTSSGFSWLLSNMWIAVSQLSVSASTKREGRNFRRTSRTLGPTNLSLSIWGEGQLATERRGSLSNWEEMVSTHLVTVLKGSLKIRDERVI